MWSLETQCWLKEEILVSRKEEEDFKWPVWKEHINHSHDQEVPLGHFLRDKHRPWNHFQTKYPFILSFRKLEHKRIEFNWIFGIVVEEGTWGNISLWEIGFWAVEGWEGKYLGNIETNWWTEQHYYFGECELDE